MRTLLMITGALTHSACTAPTTTATGDTGATGDLFTELTLTIDGTEVTETVYVSGG